MEAIEIEIDEIRRLMVNALEIRGIFGDDAQIIIEDYLSAQLQGKVTHGIGKFLLIDNAIAARDGRPVVEQEHGACVLVRGNREIGQVAAAFCIDVLCRKVSELGVGLVALTDVSRYSQLGTFGRRVASRGVVGIIMNNSGPPATAPYGGIDPILGTNPICFAFPGRESPVIIDFSTSARVWGEIRQAVLENRPLPDEAFLDCDGNVTMDAAKANSVLPFGSHKGYGLCLAIEILAGCLTGARAGLDVSSQYELGALFIGIQSSVFFPDTTTFVSRVESLLGSIRTSRGLSPGLPRIPGERADNTQRQCETTGRVVIAQSVLEQLRDFARSRTAGLASTDKLD